MQDKNTPAFPVDDREYDQNDNWSIYCGGLSKREYFAGQALAGLCANPEVMSAYPSETVVEMSVNAADAIIKELNS